MKHLILVIGVTGFIGRSLVKTLLKKTYSTCAFYVIAEKKYEPE